MSQPTPATGVVMNVQSASGFQCRLEHGPSGTKLSTDAPKDNGGTGTSFSPTDLVGAALASCALTTMALAAAREGVAWGGAKAKVEKRMLTNPRRIGELVLEIEMPAELPVDRRAQFEDLARGCPVAKSLAESLSLPMTFRYP